MKVILPRWNICASSTYRKVRHFSSHLSYGMGVESKSWPAWFSSLRRGAAPNALTLETQL